MNGRRFGRLVLLALAVGIGYWIYKDRPTVSGLVDSMTDPLMGSKAAVKTSESKRMTGDATAALTDQSDATTIAGTLREGMKTSEVKELLGPPDRIEREKVDGAEQVSWIYERARRLLVIRDGRVVSIVVRSAAAAAAP